MTGGAGGGVRPGKSIMLAGASGSGKSSFARTALTALGSGVIVMAPGQDEIESYEGLYGKANIQPVIEKEVRGDSGTWLPHDKSYLMAGFDDTGFLPSLKQWDAEGFENTLRFLRALWIDIKVKMDAGGECPYKVLVTDTFSGVGDLALAKIMSERKIPMLPPPISPDGADVYGNLPLKMAEVSRLCRAFKMFGMHWIATSHTVTKEVKKTSVATDAVALKQEVPLFVGSYREKVGQMFDLFFFTGIDGDGKHYAEWKGTAYRQAKSRYGRLGDEPRIDNTWEALVEVMDGRL